MIRVTQATSVRLAPGQVSLHVGESRPEPQPEPGDSRSGWQAQSQATVTVPVTVTVPPVTGTPRVTPGPSSIL